MLHVAHVIILEAPPALLLGVGLLVLGLERLIVNFATGPQFVLGVGEEVVRAVADEIRAANLGVGDAELGRALVGSVHELLAHELLCAVLVVLFFSLGPGWDSIPSSLRVSAAAIMCNA